ncbi:radical SAM protein [Acidianus sulfidivorans JP7]|uniref:Radical SAM protein n=1 Tax=Acidianus sulfidivorans JP7 TaxID=619593 RepID=A0A2U9IPU3_9CREN|nr:radical SAM protein [Acidianus sulfidivorans]AWR98007.1 radical SAM protein [Acidianus sulfidivorans JP7]
MYVLLSAGTYYYIKKGIKVSNTAYALQSGGCQGRCKFCSQSLYNNADKFYLSRVKWFPVEIEELRKFFSSSSFSRFCLQTVIKRNFEEEAIDILSSVNTKGKSLTTVPISDDYLLKLKSIGVDYIGTGLDTVESLWEEIGKPFSFKEYIDFIKRSVSIFGSRHVYVHLIVGLGEKEEEIIKLMKEIYQLGAEVALFAFTPVKGTPLQNLSPPKLEYYRKIQKIRYELSKGEIKEEKLAYLTSGCPSCDRPYYNEDPLKTLYNIPLRDFNERIHNN